jgi:ribose transport system substrate-binding protein
MKCWRVGVSVCLAAAIAIAITACGSSSSSSSTSTASTASAAASTSSTSAGKRFHVVWMAVGLDNTYVAAVERAVKATAAKDNLDLTILDGQFMPTLQSQQLTTLASKSPKPDGIIVFPDDSKAIIPATAAAHAAGIPITFDNQDIDPSGAKYRLGFSGPNNYTEGVHQFDLLAKCIRQNGVNPNGAKIAMGLSFAGSAANVLRVAGFKAEEAKTGIHMDVVASGFGDSDVTQSRSLAQQILTRWKTKLNGFYGQDDNVSIGIAEAVQAVGLSKQIMIVGNGLEKGAAADIANGTMCGTLDQSPNQDGSDAVNLMNAILRHKPYQQVTYMPQPLVTKANINQYPAEW